MNYSVEVCSVVIKRFLSYVGLSEKATYRTKVVPWAVLQSGREVHAAFLRGLFDTDGSLSTAGFSLSCFNVVLARQVQLMLLGLGIPSRLSKEGGKVSNNWEVRIRTGHGLLFYCNKISSNHPFKSVRVAEYLSRVKSFRRPGHVKSVPRPLLDRVRNIVCGNVWVRKGLKSYFHTLMRYGVSPQQLLKVYIPILAGAGVDVVEISKLLKLRYNEVVNISPIGTFPTYDLCVQEDPPVFLANGLAVHNSPIQALSSDITNFALTKIDKVFRENGFKARLLMQVHDAIIAEAPKEEVYDVYNIVQEQMLTPPPGFIVSLKADLGVVDRWGGEHLDLAQFE